ncbi:hypothetical protein NQ318_010111 [Aromia moschata]|uniref:Reverse transcriptase domain-containing protein n=1 Tax=Aromia moschata TaxID=1265417 RepID=A0AAV8Y884_9CUCU|nr:hypothetical protein NQ318_010111 [Aromia moschata]
MFQDFLRRKNETKSFIVLISLQEGFIYDVLRENTHGKDVGHTTKPCDRCQLPQAGFEPARIIALGVIAVFSPCALPTELSPRLPKLEKILIFTTVDISITQSVPRGGCTIGFTLLTHTSVCRYSYFQQHEGTAMGNSLSPFIANLFMSKFETEVKYTFEYFPRVWFRYVDDIFAVFDTKAISLDNFVAKLSNQFPTIKFTYEMEHNEQLPFLDVLVIRNSENKNVTNSRQLDAFESLEIIKCNSSLNKDNGPIPTSPLFALINKDSYGSMNRGNKFSINSASV